MKIGIFGCGEVGERVANDICAYFEEDGSCLARRFSIEVINGRRRPGMLGFLELAIIATDFTDVVGCTQAEELVWEIDGADLQPVIYALPAPESSGVFPIGSILCAGLERTPAKVVEVDVEEIPDVIKNDPKVTPEKLLFHALTAELDNVMIYNKISTAARVINHYCLASSQG